MSGGTRSYEMAYRMVRQGHEVHIITTKREGIIKSNAWDDENIDGIYVHWLSVPYDNKMSFFNRVYAFFAFALNSGKKAISLGGDIVLATSTPLTVAIPAVQIKKALNIPMVFEVRDLWPELPIAIGAIKNPILKYFAYKLELWAYKHSDQIVALSPGMYEGILRTGYPREKIHIIPNGSDVSLFQVKNEVGIKFKNKYKLSEQKQLIVYAGTLGKINNVGFLVDVAKEFLDINNNVEFLVVGTGYEEEKIRNKSIELNCYNKNFYMISQLPKSEMPALFNAATISTSLFLPIKEMRNNSANKFFDGLAAGKPVVINYGGWQKKLLYKYNVGISLDRNACIAAKSLNKLLLNDNLLKTFGKNSLSLAKSHFSRDDLANKMANVLELSVS